MINIAFWTYKARMYGYKCSEKRGFVWNISDPRRLVVRAFERTFWKRAWEFCLSSRRFSYWINIVLHCVSDKTNMSISSNMFQFSPYVHTNFYYLKVVHLDLHEWTCLQHCAWIYWPQQFTYYFLWRFRPSWIFSQNTTVRIRVNRRFRTIIQNGWSWR